MFDREVVKQSILICLASLVISGEAHAQSKAAPNSIAGSQAVLSALDAQWEYLVVSYGKTVFGSPEKTLAYRAIGLAAAGQEANEVQRSLDVLGRFGWEVVTIVGAIGGDQQIVFKRRYEKTRASHEASAILKGREIYLKDLMDILERERRMREEAAAADEAERSKPRLIELDAQDAQQLRARLTAERQGLIETAIRGATWGSKAVARVRADAGFTAIDVTVDVPDDLLKNGNSYRKSEVVNWVKSQPIQQLREVSQSFGGSIYMTVTANIVFGGKAVKVDEQKSSYSSYLRRWD